MIRRKILPLLTVIAAATCLAVPAALAGPSADASHAQPTAITATVPTLQFGGVMMGIHEFYTPGDALNMMQRVRDNGLNAVRLFILWNHDFLPPSRDIKAVCYAAMAAEKLELKALVINLIPTKTVWPLIQGDLDLFNDGIGLFDKALFDPGSECIKHPSPLQIIWMIGNEPNVETFCDGSDKGLNPPSGMLAQHKECAKREAMLLHSSYAFIRQEKVKYGDVLKVNDLQVIGGALSSNDAPFNLLSEYFQVRRSLGYKACDMDYFGFHPYPMGVKNGPYYGYKLVPRLQAELKANKCPVPVIFTEAGFETVSPAGLGYLEEAPRIAYHSSETEYLSVASGALKLTLSMGVVGWFNMLLDDEQKLNPGWQSGWYYWNREPKPFQPQIRQIFQGVLNPPSQGATPPTRQSAH